MLLVSGPSSPLITSVKLRWLPFRCTLAIGATVTCNGTLVTVEVRSADAGADAFGLARAYRLLGDSRKGFGDGAGAAAAWTAAFQALPRVPAERPIETQEHAIILERLGRTAEAQQLKRQLAATGYRLPEVGRV